MVLEQHSSETDGCILKCSCGCKFQIIWKLCMIGWLAAVSDVGGTMWMRKIPNYATWPALPISLSISLGAEVEILIQRTFLNWHICSEVQVSFKWHWRQEALLWKVLSQKSCAHQHYGGFWDQKAFGSPVTVVSYLFILPRPGANQWIEK